MNDSESKQTGGPGGCSRPPEGWYCTRDAGHDGPCAAHPYDEAKLRRDAVEKFRQDTVEKHEASVEVLKGTEPPPPPAGPLAGWVIALVGGKTLLGVYSTEDDGGADRSGFPTLDPAYELVVVHLPNPVMGPDGQPRIGIRTERTIAPVGHLDSWSTFVLPPDAIYKHVEDLSDADRAELANLVGGIERHFAEKARKARAEKLVEDAKGVSFGGGAR